MNQPTKKQSKREKMIEKAKEKGLKKKQQPAVDDLDFNQEPEEQIDVSFLISQIFEEHYHSLKTILEKFASLSSVSSSEWASLIIENKATGNVAVVDDDDESEDEEQSQSENKQKEDDEDQNVCSGVLSLLPQKSKIVQQLKKKIIMLGEKHGKQMKFLKKTSSFLLVNQRAINLPAFVVQNMHEVLINDHEQNESLESSYLMVQSWVEGKASEDIQSLTYSKFEDYEMLKRCKVWWLGESAPNSVRKTDLRKLYYVIGWKSYMKGVKNLKHLLQ